MYLALSLRLYVIAFATILALSRAAVALAQSSDDAVADTPQSNLVIWSSLVGVALPPVIDVIVQTNWSKQFQGIMAFLICLVASGGTVWFQGDFGDGRDMATAFLLVFSGAIASYRLYWKPSEISDSIKSATDVSR